MKLVFCTALCLSALLAAAPPALAQSSVEFQEEMVQAASGAGSARLPVACAGLFRALTNLAEEGSDQFTTLKDKESDSATVAAIARQKETDEAVDAAIKGVIPAINQGATIYLRWFTANKTAQGKLFDDVIKANFDRCDQLVSEWRTALYGN
jgi:hypothetical protein